MQTAVDVPAGDALSTVRQFSDEYRAWTQPAIRNLILNAEPRKNSRGETIPGNGLAESGAIIRLGRRVLIDKRAFFAWVRQQQQAHRRAR